MATDEAVRELLDAIREYVKAERADQFGEGMTEKAEAAAVERAQKAIRRLA